MQETSQPDAWMMFNWYSAPTFAAMLLYWLLSAYVLTRVPRGPVALVAALAQVSVAAFLFGQGMEANAPDLESWLPWARNLQWGAAVAPVAWYWLTILLLRDSSPDQARRYLDRFGYPLGIALTVGGLIVLFAIAADGLYFDWANARPIDSPLAKFAAAPGPLYFVSVIVLALGTVGALINLVLGQRYADADRKPRFAWLQLAAILFFVGANLPGIGRVIDVTFWPVWIGHIVLAAAEGVLAVNVAAYSFALRRQVVTTDLLYYVTATGMIALLYGLLILATGVPYSFSVLQLFMTILIAAVLTHALVDVGRSVLDRVFLQGDVQRLRANLNTVVQEAARAPDLDTLMEEAQEELAASSLDSFVRHTEDALRKLNNPAMLASSELTSRLPNTLAANGADPAVPAETARALRAALVSVIDALKPEDEAASGMVQYRILHDAYVSGTPNKQLVNRLAISESTFHRQRRQAIMLVATSLAGEEDRLRAGARQ